MVEIMMTGYEISLNHTKVLKMEQLTFLKKEKYISQNKNIVYNWLFILKELYLIIKILRYSIKEYVVQKQQSSQ